MDFIWGNILIGGLLAIVGMTLIKISGKAPPNFGYNMPSALKNEDTKAEANKYAGKIMMIGGVVSILIGLLLNIIFSAENIKSSKLEGINLSSFMITSMVIGVTSIALTEKHLHKTFDKNGMRRDKQKNIPVE